jgi:flagella basal body P-ring formation protein FlgA
MHRLLILILSRIGPWFKGIGLLVAGILAAGGAYGGQPATLTLKATAVVEHDVVTLSEVASLAGSFEQHLQALGATQVARSPQPGQTRFVGADYIRIRLKQAGFDTAALVFKGAQDVRVTRRSAALPTQRIQRAVEAAIRSRMPWNNEDVTIRGIQFDGDVNLPTGKLTYRIVPKRHEDYLGSTILALHLYVDGDLVRKLWVNATISVMADVVTVVQPLGKHQHIQLEDLSIQRRDLSDLTADTVKRLEDALGCRTTRMIYPNTVLRSGMVALPPLVKRGDLVKIVANAGPMTITATGLVKQQGRKGDMVRVMNTDSKRVISARVTGPGAVTVDF